MGSPVFKKKTKICILTSVHPAFDVRIFYKEAASLVRAGYEIALIAQNDKDEIANGAKIIALPFTKNRFSRMFVTAFRLFSLALRQKAAVYHFHDPELIIIGLWLKLATKAKVVYDAHEDVSKIILSRQWICGFARRFVSAAFGLAEKSLSRYFDYVIAATPSIASNFRQKNVVVVANFPDINSFPERPAGGSDMAKEEFWLAYCGVLSGARGIREIVLSLGLIAPGYKVRLRLLGSFEGVGFKRELEGLKEWAKVEYGGYLPQDEISKVLLRSDLGLACLYPQPNHINSLPIKMFEYMAVGLPVIASNFPLWKEIVEGNKCGICVNPLEPKEIARAVEYLIEHPLEAKKMAENGRKAVAEKYNWRIEEKKLLGVYDELAK